jgi:hypothetical protein
LVKGLFFVLPNPVDMNVIELLAKWFFEFLGRGGVHVIVEKFDEAFDSKKGVSPKPPKTYTPKL